MKEVRRMNEEIRRHSAGLAEEPKDDSPLLLSRMRPEELAEVRTEFKCSLYDDLTIRLEDIFRRVP